MKRVNFSRAKIIIVLFFCSPFINAAEKLSVNQAAPVLFATKASEQEAAAALLLLAGQPHSAPASNSNLYDCNRCARKYPTLQKLNNHLYNTISAYRNGVLCSYKKCCSISMDKAAAQLHAQTHFVVSYGCTACKANFSRPSAFNGHRLIHQKTPETAAELTATCSACKETYLWNTNAPHSCIIQDDKSKETPSDIHVAKQARTS
jgi:hypothetical protein